MNMDIDWMQASQEDRKILYHVFKAILDRYALKPKDVYAQAYHGSAYANKEYEDEKNFRAGRINKKRASLLYQWICSHHPIHAQEIIDKIYAQKPRPITWTTVIDGGGALRKVHTTTTAKPLYRVSFARITGKDNNGNDILSRPREIGEAWLRQGHHEGLIITLDIIPTDLINRNGVLFLVPVGDEES
ncbi:MAG: hypothetical protein AAF228_12670 [Pseudomonadota bacterium]